MQPSSPHLSRFRPFIYEFLILFAGVGIRFYLFYFLDSVGLFRALLSKAGTSSTLTFVLVLTVKAVIGAQVLDMMLPEDQAGTSGTKRPRPESPLSPLPSISSGGVERAYGDGGEAGPTLSQGPVTPGSINSVDQDDIWREVEKAGASSAQNMGMEGLPLSRRPETPFSIQSVNQDEIWEALGEASSSAPPLGGQQEGGDANPTAAPDLLLHEEKEEELKRIIERLPQKELREIIGKESLNQAIENAEKRTALFNRASQHLEKKEEILDLISSMYPEKQWEHSRLIREKFFLTTRDRELELEKLNKIVNDLTTKEKGKCYWARELNYRLDWKE